MFNKQHAGFNLEVIGNTLALDDAPALGRFKLMMLLDRIDNRDPDLCDGFETIEYRVPREVHHSYLVWLGNIWVGADFSYLEEVVPQIDSYCAVNRERLRRAAMSGMI